jgi:hypothetical protein
VTFADSVLHLVRAGARIDSWGGPASAAPPEASAAVASETAAVASEAIATETVRSDAYGAPSPATDEARLLATQLAAEASAEASQEMDQYQPGLGDLEAGVGLVSAGLATRVVLAGFPSWPGLLWRAYQLAESADVLILPTVVRPGGKVDIVITRDIATNG